MPLSPETENALNARRARLMSFLTLPLSYDEIAEVMHVPQHVVGNDITMFRKHACMPERPTDMSYTAKLRLYLHALKNQMTVENGYAYDLAVSQSTEKKALITVLRDALDIRNVVKMANLMLKGVAMQRMPKLPKELWRTATIWRLALRSYEANNWVDHDFWRSRLKPAPYVATFTVQSFEDYLERFYLDVILVARSAEELAERFVAHLEFRAKPGNGLVMTPTEAWDEDLVRVDLVITATTRELIEGIINTHESINDEMRIMLEALVPEGDETGKTLEEIGQQLLLTRERVRMNIAKALRIIRVGLHNSLHLDIPKCGIDVTDTARLLHTNEVEDLRKRLLISEARLAERTEILVSNGLLSHETAASEGIGVVGEEVFASLCKRVDELDLGVRTANCLANQGLEFIWQVAEKNENDLLKSKNFGRRSLNELKEVLANHGLSLGMKIPAVVRVRFTTS